MTEKPKSNFPENEIRVSGKTNVLKAVQRIGEALKTFDNVIISGINTGISKVLLIAEIAKLKEKEEAKLDLHQYNLIETITREVHEEDKEKDEETGEIPKFLTRFKVELYKTKQASAPKGTFYEAPYTEEQHKAFKEAGANRPQSERPRTGRGGFGGRSRGRGRGRGGERGAPRDGFRGGRRDGEGRGAPRGGRGGDRAPRGDRKGTARGENRGRGAPRGENRGRGAPRGRGTPRGGKKGDIEGL